MQAMILAGGRGQRLRPITDYTPKPLIPIRNIPILEWQLQYLAFHAIKDVVVCSGYKSGMIQHFLERHHYGRVTLSVEDSPLGTGGAMRKAAKHITDSECVILNGDIITDIALDAMPANSVAAIPLRTRFGVLDLKDDVVIKFSEKDIIRNMWMNAGIYRLDTDMLHELPINGNIEKTQFPQWAAAGRLRAARFPDARWYSIDSFKDVEECSEHIMDIMARRSTIL